MKQRKRISILLIIFIFIIETSGISYALRPLASRNSPHKTADELFPNISPSGLATDVVKENNQGANILSLGPGDFVDEKYFAANGFNVIAIEKDKRNEQYVKGTKNITPIWGDMREVLRSLAASQKERFGIVYARLSLHYFSKQELEEIFRLINEVLAPGGRIYFVVKSKDDPYYTGAQSKEDPHSWLLAHRDLETGQENLRQFFDSERVYYYLDSVGLQLRELRTFSERLRKTEAPGLFDSHLSQLLKVYAQRASSAGIGQQNSIKVIVEFEGGKTVDKTFSLPEDFHLRILTLSKIAAWARSETGIRDGFKIGFESVNGNGSLNLQTVLDDFKDLWVIEGFELDLAAAMLFRIKPTERCIAVKSLIRTADECIWGQKEETWQIGAKRGQRARTLPVIGQGEKPRILLISSAAREDVVETNRQEGRLIAPNFGLYRLKAYLESKGYAEVDVFNPEVYGGSEDVAWRLVDLMQRRRYHMIGFSPTHSNLLEDLRTAWLLKKVDTMIDDSNHPLFIAGGNEATTDAENLLRHSPLDIAAIGFGESIIANIAGAIAQHDTRPLEDILADMKVGVAYIDNNGDFAGKSGATMTDMDFQEYNYRNQPLVGMPYRVHWIHSALSISPANLLARNASLCCIRLFFTSHCAKGTPCGYCANCLLANQHLLSLSAEQMAELVKKAVDMYHPEAVFLNDDDTVMGGSRVGKERFIEFCRTIRRLKDDRLLPADLKFYMQTRSKCLVSLNKRKDGYEADMELINAMKEAGFVQVSLGIESFSDAVLAAPSIRKVTAAEVKELEGKGLKPSDIHKIAIEGLLKAGVTPQLNIIGMPPEATTEDILITISTSIDYALKGAQLALSTYVWYLPGADLANEEAYKKRALEFCVKGIKGTDIFYPYYNRYIPFDENLRAITEIGNIWRRADKEWEQYADRLIQENHPFAFDNPPLQFRVLMIFIAELELIAEHISESGQKEEAGKIWTAVAEAKKKTWEIINNNLPPQPIIPLALRPEHAEYEFRYTTKLRLNSGERYLYKVVVDKGPTGIVRVAIMQYKETGKIASPSQLELYRGGMKLKVPRYIRAHDIARQIGEFLEQDANIEQSETFIAEKIKTMRFNSAKASSAGDKHFLLGKSPFVYRDTETGEIVLRIFADFEETVTPPYAQQQLTLDGIVLSSITSSSAKAEFAAKIKRTRAQVLTHPSEATYRQYYGIFAGPLTLDHCKTLAESYTLSENFITLVKRIKEVTKVDRIEITIVGRGLTQPFKMFFSRPVIRFKMDELSVKVVKLITNTLEFDGDGVFRGRIAQDPLIIEKDRYVESGALFLGDARDAQYGIQYFIDVNKGPKQREQILLRWLKAQCQQGVGGSMESKDRKPAKLRERIKASSAGDYQTLVDIRIEELRPGDEGFETARNVLSNPDDPIERAIARVQQDLVKENWWLSPRWQDKGLPKEQISISVNRFNVDIYNWRDELLTGEQLSEITDTLRLFSVIADGKALGSCRYILIDNVQEKNPNSGEDMNGIGEPSYKAIVLYPRALLPIPHRVVGVSNLRGTLIHELTHKLIDATTWNEWAEKFGWQYIHPPRQLPGGAKSSWQIQDLSLAITGYATHEPGEDICESMVAAMGNPDILDKERLRYLNAKFLQQPTTPDRNIEVGITRFSGAQIYLPRIEPVVRFRRNPLHIRIRKRETVAIAPTDFSPATRSAAPRDSVQAVIDSCA